MYKQARGMTSGTVGSAAALFNPILSNAHLDMLGGVGEYTLPQRGAGMTLGALVGSRLAGPEHRDVGALAGAGAGYMGAAALDSVVGGTRRRVVEDAIRRSVDNNSIIVGSEDMFMAGLKNYAKHKGGAGSGSPEDVDRILKQLTTPAYTVAGDIPTSGMIVNNYDYMHRLTNNPDKLETLLQKARGAGFSNNVMNKVKDRFNEAAGSYVASPDVARYPVMSHELLERKDLLYNLDPAKADYDGMFKGKALDRYGLAVAMKHNSMEVLGDETNMALRTMTPEEVTFMRGLRDASGEASALSSIKNVDDMYDVTVRNSEMKPWAKTTSTAIERGLESGKLLNSAEQALVDPGTWRAHSGRAGRALRQAEHAIAAPVSKALSEAASSGYGRLSKYLTKFL